MMVKREGLNIFDSKFQGGPSKIHGNSAFLADFFTLVSSNSVGAY